MMRWWMFLVLVAVSVTATSSAPSEIATTQPRSECDKKSHVGFSVISSTSSDGQANVQTELDHEITSTWKIDVDMSESQYDNSDTTRRYLIIEMKGPLTPLKRRTVPLDHIHLEGLGEYKLHKIGQTWPDAKKTCEQEGGYLAIPNSKQEMVAITSLVKDAQHSITAAHPSYIHVGIVKHGSEWRTLDGRTPKEAGFAEWYANYPSAEPNFKCVMTDLSMQYFNYPCENKYPFVCEFNFKNNKFL